MSKKKFNPKDWATVRADLRVCPKPNNCPNNPRNDIETVIARIEATGADIAPNYADWRDLGFALAPLAVGSRLSTAQAKNHSAIAPLIFLPAPFRLKAVLPALFWLRPHQPPTTHP